MANKKLPNIPDVTGKTIQEDKQLRNLLIAMKITLEKITSGKTEAEIIEILTNN